MNPLNLLGPSKWLVYLGLALSCGLYIDARGYQRAEDKFTRAADAAKIKADDATALLQAQLDAAKNTQEMLDETHRTTIATLATQLRLRAGPAQQLRDPHATGCPATAPAAPADPGAGDGTQTGGLLSAELTGLLQRLTHEADEINNAYASCRPDSFSIRAEPAH